MPQKKKQEAKMAVETKTMREMLGKELYNFTFGWEFGDFHDPRFRPRMEALVTKFKEISSEFLYNETQSLLNRSIRKEFEKENRILEKSLYVREIQLKEAEEDREKFEKENRMLKRRIEELEQELPQKTSAKRKKRA